MPLGKKPDKKPPRLTSKDALFPGQHEGEEIFFFFRQHPMVMRKALILGLLLILLTVLPLDFPFTYNSPGLSSLCVKLSLITTTLVLAYWVYRYSLWYYSVFIVTGERTVSIHHRSFFNREVRALFHGSVHSVDYTIPGLSGALFGYGNIVVYTWVGNFPINIVHHPAELHQQLLEVIRNSRDHTDPPQEGTGAILDGPG